MPEGATVVFSAHGVAPSVHANAAGATLQTIDATCPLVTKVHVEAKRFAADGYTIVLIGHAGHEEVEGTMGEAPENIVLVADRGRRRPARGRRPGPGRLHLPDHPVGRRDARDHQSPAPALPGDHRTPHRRHLLRDDQPPGRGQAARRAVRPGAGDRLAQLVQLQPAGRGGARARRGLAPDRHRGRGARGVARRQARGRHHLRRERARGARAAAGRVLPRRAGRPTCASSTSSTRTFASCCPRSSARAWRPKAPPSGAANRPTKATGALRTLVVSDLHLGARGRQDVLRRERERTALVAALAGSIGWCSSATRWSCVTGRSATR